MWFWYKAKRPDNDDGLDHDRGLVKSHGCDQSLADALCKDLADRYNAELDPEPKEPFPKLFWEVGYIGPMLMGQPKITFEVGDKQLETYCRLVDIMLHELEEAKEKEFTGGGKYYKLYSSYTCLVLTPEERESLLFQLRGAEDSAHEEYMAFLDKIEKRMNQGKEKDGE